MYSFSQPRILHRRPIISCRSQRFCSSGFSQFCRSLFPEHCFDGSSICGWVSVQLEFGDTVFEGVRFHLRFFVLFEPYYVSSSALTTFYYGNLSHPSQDPPKLGFLSTVPPDASSRMQSAASAAAKANNNFPCMSLFSFIRDMQPMDLSCFLNVYIQLFWSRLPREVSYRSEQTLKVFRKQHILT